MATTRQNVVSTATKRVGAVEGYTQHKSIIDGYNKHTPLARGYRVKYTDAWCATFVSFVAIECGITDIMPTECGCGQMIQLYQKLGRWVERDNYVPKPGDIVMYDWQDTGTGDNTGWPDHVGIVVSVTGSTMKIIEGNINNSVGYRTLAVNGKYIRGYCTPNYESKDNTAVKDAIDATIENCISDIGMDSPDYWEDVLRGTKVATAASVKALMDKYHNAFVKAKR